MRVTRIVANIAADDLAPARRFYGDLLGLELRMDHGWIATWGGEAGMTVQVSIARKGGSGAPVPDLSVEVDDIATAEARFAAAEVPFAYGPADEPWGVRRFFVRDPFGRLVNVLAHRRDA